MDFEYFLFCTKDKNEFLDILRLICDTISAKYNDSHSYSFKSKQHCCGGYEGSDYGFALS